MEHIKKKFEKIINKYFIQIKNRSMYNIID